MNHTLVLAAFVSLLGAASSFAAPLVNAPSIFVDSDQYQGFEDSSAQLTGHVKIIRGSEQLTADRAFINPTKNEVTAEGNVLLVTPKDYVRAERMIYNFQTKKGIVYNGFIQMGQETIEGEEIYKLGETEYRAKNATYTACVNCPPAWKLSGTNIDASVGSYAYITSPLIRLYGFPVLWLPYMVIPIKTERQSGLLTPIFGSSSTSGFTFGDSYFWAIARNKDATLTGIDYAARGLKTGLEYRFINDKDSYGTFQGYFLNDFEYGHDTTYLIPDLRYMPTPRNPVTSIARFALHYNSHFELPDGYVSNITLNDVRDSHYIDDFQLEMPYLGDSALENRVSLAKNTEDTHASVDVDVYENLLGVDPVGGNEDAIHRVPELEYSVMPTHLFGTDLLGRLDIDYANFMRPDSAYDNLSGVPNSQLTPAQTGYRTGQRLILSPTLSYPMSFLDDTIDLLPEVAFDATYYEFGYSSLPNAERQYLRATLDAKLRTYSIFGDNTDADHHRYKHEFIPEINYTYVPYLYQTYHPFLFGNQNYGSNSFNGNFIPEYVPGNPVTEFDNLQFDYQDRLTDLNMVTFDVSNVFIQKRISKEGKTDYKQVVKHQFIESYDSYLANGPPNAPAAPGSQPGAVGPAINLFPWSPLHSILQVSYDYFSVASDLYYYWYDNTIGHTSSVTFTDKNKNAIQLAYTQSYYPKVDPNSGIMIDQVDPSTIARVASVTTYLASPYIDFSGSAAYDLVNQVFTTISVTGILKPPGKCYGIGATYLVTPNGANAYNSSITLVLPIFFGEGKSFGIGRPAGI